MWTAQLSFKLYLLIDASMQNVHSFRGHFLILRESLQTVHALVGELVEKGFLPK